MNGRWTVVFSNKSAGTPWVVCHDGRLQARFHRETWAYEFIAKQVAKSHGEKAA